MSRALTYFSGARHTRSSLAKAPHFFEQSTVNRRRLMVDLPSLAHAGALCRLAWFVLRVLRHLGLRDPKFFRRRNIQFIDAALSDRGTVEAEHLDVRDAEAQHAIAASG